MGPGARPEGWLRCLPTSLVVLSAGDVLSMLLFAPDTLLLLLAL